MRKALLFSLALAMVLLLASCQKAITCNEPYIEFEKSCCLDQDSNGICDEDEKAAAQPSTPGADASAQENTPEDATTEEPGSDEAESQSDDQTLDVEIEEAEDIDDFLETFRGKKTQIIFGEEAGAPLVAATINLLAYYGNPYNMDYSMIAADASMADLPGPTNLILLGNGCTNNYIREMLSLTKEGCMGSLGDDKGMVKIMKADGKYVLMIMAKEDADVHSIVNSLVKEEIDVTGNEMEVDLS
ncbi:hypothetical protein JXB28_00775 [Candidatus Woesearchaeota archaeon]|nr:hypothetical protein [Candidatus Woesearchaeota archaeon]